MNLRNWSTQHTAGLIVGLVLPMLFIPLVVAILAAVQHYTFEAYWDKFWFNSDIRSKFLSLSVLVNIGVFYLFLNREKYNFAMGIILGSMLYLPYILYVLFF